MSLTKFTENVSNHQAMPDKPALTSAQMKALFDKAVNDIKTYINGTLTEEIDSKTNELTNKINSIYPVGSIYMSVNNTNPGTLFGGTWVAWGTGKVPVGVSIEETEFNEVEKTGGAKTHTLTTEQIPSHGHSVSIPSSGSCTISSSGGHSHQIKAEKIGATGDVRAIVSGNGSSTYSAISGNGEHTHTVPNHTHTVNQSNVGGGQAHNNLQPYITCYMWKRTA